MTDRKVATEEQIKFYKEGSDALPPFAGIESKDSWLDPGDWFIDALIARIEQEQERLDYPHEAIADLRAECARLREALVDIAGMTLAAEESVSADLAKWARDIALAALADKGGEGERDSPCLAHKWEIRDGRAFRCLKCGEVASKEYR